MQKGHPKIKILSPSNYQTCLMMQIKLVGETR